MFLYCGSDDIVYVNGSYLALYAVSAGEKTVDFGGPRAYRELLKENGLCGAGKTLVMQMQAHETRLFELNGIY